MHPRTFPAHLAGSGYSIREPVGIAVGQVFTKVSIPMAISFRSEKHGRRCYIAILDVGMPQLNGYEVARKSRSEEWGHHLSLVALTGWAHEDDKRHALAAGFGAHMTKPVDTDELNKQLASCEPVAGQQLRRSGL